ncbi:TonB-dependent receptor domain-containing protein [Allopusillimonas ginsengisoli]|uniref:TonB-dependent receptor domain-containing protein n=1 Tax=Allopusillimonas ginsengisoli TaxID=453575 RepID=UPI001020139E|nr:TonB-dependent receptor [Allopusillimonas ginsengisoli]TEA78293.1 TonB-dependent receptor [Allopusillimonas ginsengisoli]
MPVQRNQLALAILSLSISCVSHAQATSGAVAPPSSGSGIPSLDGIVVTPGRAAESEKNVIGDVTVIDRKTLERAGADSVAQILSRQPDLQFYNTGGPQTSTGIFLRGAKPAQTLVLIDGIRANDSVAGGFNWNSLDAATIERIEIVRGAASSLYGSDAIGGVINIITSKGGEDRPFAAHANIGLGSHSTFKSGAGFSGAQDGWNYAFSASMAESSGFNSSNPDAGPYSYHDDKDGYSQHSLSGSVGYRWKPGHHVGITAYNSYINADYDAGAFAHPAYSLNRQQAYSITSTDALTDYWESVLRLGLSKTGYEDRAWNAIFSTLQRSFTWQNNVRLGEGQRVSAVFERLEERPQHSENFDVSRRDTNSVGLIYRADVGAHHLQASVRNDNITGYGNETTGGLGYDLDVTPYWTVGVAANTGFRAPTFSDLYYPYYGNPDLKPEKSRNVEARVTYAKDNMRFGVTAFQNRVRDMIGSESLTFRSINIDEARLRGVTLTGEYAWGNTTLGGSADFLDPEDVNTGKQLNRRARQVYRLNAQHAFGTLQMGAEYMFVGKRYDDTANQIRLGGYSLMNLTAEYALTHNASVQVRWDNILDKRYSNAYGYNMPGSTVFVNLAVRM